MSTFSAIDIGSNSVRLLIADINDDFSYKVLSERNVVTRLGAGLQTVEILNEQSKEATLECLRRYRQETDVYGVKNISVAGTNALRIAEGSEAFINDISEICGAQMQVISGEKEALYSFTGATADRHDPDEKMLVMDIGGGSTEFIIGNTSSIQGVLSLPMGAVRLSEKYLIGSSDPPPYDVLTDICQEINEKLEKNLSKDWANVDIIIGTGGTITTLGSMAHALTKYDPDIIHGTRMTTSMIGNILNDLTVIPDNERKMYPGMDPRRSDIIIAGILIVMEILRYQKAESITISIRDILLGMILEAAGADLPALP